MLSGPLALHIAAMPSSAFGFMHEMEAERREIVGTNPGGFAAIAAWWPLTAAGCSGGFGRLTETNRIFLAGGADRASGASRSSQIRPLCLARIAQPHSLVAAWMRPMTLPAVPPPSVSLPGHCSWPVLQAFSFVNLRTWRDPPLVPSPQKPPG